MYCRGDRYGAGWVDLTPMDEMDLAKGPGRTCVHDTGDAPKPVLPRTKARSTKARCTIQCTARPQYTNAPMHSTTSTLCRVVCVCVCFHVHVAVAVDYLPSGRSLYEFASVPTHQRALRGPSSACERN